MANRSFVVQYIIQARERYVATADKVSRATKQMQQRIADAQSQMVRFRNVTTQAMRKIKEQVTAAQKRMHGFRDAGLKMSAFVTAPLLLIARSFKNAARDAVETRSKFATVFKDMSSMAETSADRLAKSYGLTGTEARKLLGDTGDILTGFGFTQKSAFDLSMRVNQLAVDLASFTNYSGGAEGASAALTKAMLGEREQLKSLGVAISEDNVKRKIAELVSKGQHFASLRQAKAQATLAIAIEQSKNAIGDFSRTQNDLANQERTTSARIQDLKESFGRILLPVALLVTKTIRRIAEWLTELSPTAKKAILIIGALVAVIGPLLLIVAGLGVAIPAITAAFAALGPVLAAGSVALGPVLLIAVALAAVAVLIVKNWEKISAFFAGFSSGIRSKLGPTFGRLVGYFEKTAAIISALFGSNGEATENLRNFALVGKMVGEAVGTALDFVLRTLMSIGAALGQIIGAVTSGDFGQFDLGQISDIWSGFEKQTPNVKTMKTENRVNVGVNVGLDQGLTQTTPAAVTTRGVRRADVGGLHTR